MGASICADPALMAADNGSLPLTENCGNWVGICPAADLRIALAASSPSVSTAPFGHNPLASCRRSPKLCSIITGRSETGLAH